MKYNSSLKLFLILNLSLPVFVFGQPVSPLDPRVRRDYYKFVVEEKGGELNDLQKRDAEYLSRFFKRLDELSKKEKLGKLTNGERVEFKLLDRTMTPLELAELKRKKIDNDKMPKFEEIELSQMDRSLGSESIAELLRCTSYDFKKSITCNEGVYKFSSTSISDIGKSLKKEGVKEKDNPLYRRSKYENALKKGVALSDLEKSDAEYLSHYFKRLDELSAKQKAGKLTVGEKEELKLLSTNSASLKMAEIKRKDLDSIELPKFEQVELIHFDFNSKFLASKFRNCSEYDYQKSIRCDEGVYQFSASMISESGRSQKKDFDKGEALPQKEKAINTSK